MCGVTLRNRISSIELNGRLGIVGVEDVVRRGRLRRYGHLERKNSEDWVSARRNVEIIGGCGSGRNKKSWKGCVEKDMAMLGMRREWALDHAKLHNLIWGNRPTSASM